MEQTGVKLYEQKKLSSAYANVRAQYPDEWTNSILNYAANAPHNLALDVACGSGQAAKALSKHFSKVIAVDQSSSQINSSHGESWDNIEFKQGEAEELQVEDGSIDLLVVAQALHWFNLPKFFAEANRVMHSGSVFVASVYGPEMLFPNSPEITALISAVLTKLWEELKDVTWTKLFVPHYKDIDIPFSQVQRNSFEIKRTFSRDQVISWISTWAALQTFKKMFPERQDPTIALVQQLPSLLPEESEIVWKGTLILAKKE